MRVGEASTGDNRDATKNLVQRFKVGVLANYQLAKAVGLVTGTI
jgi:hypothetical protein